MSVREIATEIRERQREIGILYKPFQTRKKELETRIQQASELLQVMNEVEKSISESTRYSDPLEIKADKFMEYRNSLEETYQKLLQVESGYQNIFGTAAEPKPSKESLEERTMNLIGSGVNNKDDLTRSLGIDRTKVSAVISKLNKDGFIKIDRSEEDRRRSVYSLVKESPEEKAAEIESVHAFNFEDWFNRLRKDEDYETFITLGSSGLNILQKRQTTSDVFKISKATQIPVGKVEKTLKSLEYRRILVGNEMSEYGQRLIEKFRGLDIPTQIAFYMGRGPKPVSLFCELIGAEHSIVMNGIDQLKGCTKIVGNGYALSNEAYERIDNFRKRIRSTGRQKIEEKTEDSPPILTSKNFSESFINNMTKGVAFSVYEQLAPHCDPKELRILNEAITKASEEEISVRDFYRRIGRIRDKYSSPNVQKNRRTTPNFSRQAEKMRGKSERRRSRIARRK